MCEQIFSSVSHFLGGGSGPKVCAFFSSENFPNLYIGLYPPPVLFKWQNLIWILQIGDSALD